MTQDSFNANDIVEQVSNGQGIFIAPSFLDEENIIELKQDASLFEPDRFGTIRCLLNHSTASQRLVADDRLLRICDQLFQTEFKLGTYDIKRCPAHDTSVKYNPHVDYPFGYAYQTNIDSVPPYAGMPLGLKAFIPLTDLTLESGATAYIPTSQLWNSNPDKSPGVFERQYAENKTERLIVKAGTLALWTSLWHADLPNRSEEDRLLIHLCYVPSFVESPHRHDLMYGNLIHETKDKTLKALLS